MTLEEAWDVADQIKLNRFETYIEPSRFTGYLFNNATAAVALRMTFNAKPWPTISEDIFLMYVEPSPDVSAWIGSCGYNSENIEIVAILFASHEDRKKFQKVIWPER